AKTYFVATPAFYRTYGAKTFGFPAQLDVRLQNPAATAGYLQAAHHAAELDNPDAAQQFNGRSVQEGVSSIRSATRVQALALGLVALAAVCAGFLALGQMIARSVASKSDEFFSLRAMGVSQPARARLVAVSFLP